MEHPITRYRMRYSLTLEGFGRLVGATKASVCRWEKNDGPSLTFAKLIEEKTKGAIRKEQLRPDVWETQ